MFAEVSDIVSGQPRSSSWLAAFASNKRKRQEIVWGQWLSVFRPECAVAGQQLPDGHYHLDRMLVPLGRRGEVACCGSCMDARGIEQGGLIDGARRSTLEELADWVEWADQVLTF